MEYTFEKISSENAYQVRLNGEFIMYSEEKDSEYVDRVLKEHGWESREQYFEHLIIK